MTKTALFPGSFDPFTAGHLNILKRALTMFDNVVVAVGINQDKRSFFDMEKKLEIIRKAMRVVLPLHGCSSGAHVTMLLSVDFAASYCQQLR
ncbi:MAG: adenylyltransferase/cytidyltransferase family protein [Bacteroidales bacterium]|nr:adenylyltransferase/cytidyltransferase family protein [Bacteroidales bacterium]